MKWFQVGLLSALFCCQLAEAQTTKDTNRFQYKTDYAVIKEVGDDLYNSLKPTFRAQLSQHPLWIKEDPRPYVRPFRFQNQNGPGRIVYVSDSFLRLANSIAHAKAIDRIEPGFFQKFTASLSREAAEQLVPDLPQFTEARYWTDDVMNEQMGYFNQIIGATTAIAMAHHYLGHFDKYESQLHDSAINPATMANTCTLGEWQRAMKLGAANALDCGMAFDGLKAVLDCIDQMEKRPGWSLYILPHTAKLNVAKIKEDLTGVENLFFGQK
jgi:hypothetical protein